MQIRSRRQRPGISLLEVLTAIFIMGVGMLALLTLFPLGALSMARAIRDDRAAHIAANAASLAVAFELRNDTHLNRRPDPNNPSDKGEGFEHLDYKVTDNSLPSNPVFVDPYYARLTSALPLGEIRDGSTVRSPGILRVAPSYVYNGNAVDLMLTARWFTFQDEITFDTLGGAKGWPNTVDRPGTYTIAYLVRRPRQDTRELVDLTVVVFASRNIDFFEREQTIWNNQNMGTTGQTQISLKWQGPGVLNTSGEKPDFRKGMWILDSSRLDASTNVVNGHFYRIESVTEAGNVFLLELDRPLKANVNCIVAMSNVISVVERGTAWLP